MKLVLVTVSFALVASVAACSKPTPEEQKKQEEALAAALTSAMLAPSAAPGGDSKGGSVAGPVLATCVDTGASTCREFKGLVPTTAEEFCKRGDTGKFAKGSTPCPRDGVVGTCTSKGDDASEIRYRYKAKDETAPAAADNAKAACEMVSGVWAATTLAATPAGPAAKAAPAAVKPKKK